jgi:hypothetical protein
MGQTWVDKWAAFARLTKWGRGVAEVTARRAAFARLTTPGPGG